MDRADRVRDIVSKIGEGQPIQLTIEKRQSRRSIAENSYYWGVIIKIISDHTGENDWKIHGILGRMFLTQGVEVNGKRYEVTKSSHFLTVAEFEEYAEKCRLWAGSELDLVVPAPNEFDGEY